MTFDYQKQVQGILETFKEQMDEPDVTGSALQLLIEENKEEFADVVLSDMLDVYGDDIF